MPSRIKWTRAVRPTGATSAQYLRSTNRPLEEPDRMRCGVSLGPPISDRSTKIVRLALACSASTQTQDIDANSTEFLRSIGGKNTAT